MRAPNALLLILLSALLTAACGPKVDLSKELQVEVVKTGWFDVGMIEGKNKLVPTVSFRLKNTSQAPLVTLQVNAIFRRVTDTEEWGSAFMPAAGSDGLPPGGSTETILAKSQLGYTGTESRADMLKNALFVDAKVDLFAKYASTQWVRLGEYPVTRQLFVP